MHLFDNDGLDDGPTSSVDDYKRRIIVEVRNHPMSMPCLLNVMDN